MIWAYLIHLGQNMWRGPKGDPYPLGKYSEIMVTEDKAWRKVIDFLHVQGVNMLLIDLAEAVQYESHPELACEGAWSKDKLKKELDYIRSLGMTPIPKLNFSTHHDVWLKEYSQMVSTPIYYQVVRNLIDEVCELFDYPELFHIGMDEETYNPDLPFFYIEMQPKTGYTCVRGGELFWEDFNYIVSCVEQNGVRAWSWACPFWVYPEVAVKKIPKSVLISNAQYQRLLNPAQLPTYAQAAIQAFYIIAENGYEQLPNAMQLRSLNVDDTMYLTKDLPNIKGYMMTPWVRTREIDVMAHKAAGKLFRVARDKYFSK